MTTEREQRPKFGSAAGWGLLLLLPLLGACGKNSGSTPQGGPITVAPTLEGLQKNFVDVSCVKCHTSATAKNRWVDLTDILALTKAGDHTTEAGHHHRILIQPGCPKQSLFLSILKEGKMPPSGDAVPASTLQALETWIVSLKPNAGTSCNSDEPQDSHPVPGEP